MSCTVNVIQCGVYFSSLPLMSTCHIIIIHLVSWLCIDLACREPILLLVNYVGQVYPLPQYLLFPLSYCFIPDFVHYSVRKKRV